MKTQLKFWKLHVQDDIFLKFDIYFLGLSLEIFFGVITDN